MTKVKSPKLNVFETFAGIGAQHKAIRNSKANMKVIGTSEWDVRAMIAYAQIHNKNLFNKKLKEVEEWSNEKVINYLNERTFSLNSKVPGKITRKDRIFQNNVIAANIANNNFPDIQKIIAEDIEGTDLLTYSFPCQGLSIANMGRAKGIKPDSCSTSNLIWQIKRLLDDVIAKKMGLPKYLLMENVTALIGKKHIEDYNAWKGYLDSIGYKTYTFTQIGTDHKSLQKRKRVFALSIKKEFANKIKINEEEMSNLLIQKYGKKLSIKERENKYIKILNSSSPELIEMSIPNNTKSRVRMADENVDLIDKAKEKQYLFNTLTTKQDRHPNIGMIPHSLDLEGKLHKRFITPKEGYLIMGFNERDFDNVLHKYKENILTKESLYRQAGNSIVVQVLESIFKLIEDIERGKYE